MWKVQEKHDQFFFWFLTLKVKSIRYFSDKNNFFFFSWIFDHFWIFSGNLNYFENCKSENFQIMFYYSLTVWKCHNWNQRSKILQILIFFYDFKMFPAWLFYKTYFWCFLLFQSPRPGRNFFCTLLSVQYLNLTIRCVSWE